ncbi:SMI1/KNR4 family protein [Bacillus amyloliquefaciens]|uniref:SMI1/KNR4 family protein n=1 Tax=Bacillus amyloliquefaciens TaxID=1390 RepID=UPI002DB86A4E|nr:SMI1/KNR4 family protein [Bacillus amyloliquefaciens]MEC3841855.1 SMI1/KNR4 family protein [Bacillus amyloliquefaciens]
MNYSRVKKFFDENKEYSILTGGVTDKHIKEIEKDLKVTLPDSYKWFLTEYGSGGAFGTMILGYDSHGAEVVEQTKEYRTFYNLIPGLIVIEDIDEFSYCLDTNRMVDGECPVILWDNHEGYGFTAANTFLEFFLQRLEKGKEDLDEDEDWED